MPLGKKRLFGLDHSFQTSLFQVVPGSLGCDGLVGDVLESLSDLDSILSLPGCDEVLSIASICLRKLGRPSTSGLLGIRVVSSAKPGDGTNVKTSRE